MKKQLFTLLLICTGYVHSAAINPQDTKRNDAIKIIGSAWTFFSEQWKDPKYATDKSRAEEFKFRTNLDAAIIYASDIRPEAEPCNLLPAVPCRPGLAGLKIGKNNIECFVSNPTDPIEDLTMQSVNPYAYRSETLAEINQGAIFWPTIWHFLASEKGKQIVQEYLELEN